MFRIILYQVLYMIFYDHIRFRSRYNLVRFLSILRLDRSTYWKWWHDFRTALMDSIQLIWSSRQIILRDRSIEISLFLEDKKKKKKKKKGFLEVGGVTGVDSIEASAWIILRSRRFEKGCNELNQHRVVWEPRGATSRNSSKWGPKLVNFDRS